MTALGCSAIAQPLLTTQLPQESPLVSLPIELLSLLIKNLPLLNAANLTLTCKSLFQMQPFIREEEQRRLTHGEYHLKTLGEKSHKVACLKIHRDHLITGSSDNTCRIWNLTSGQCLRELEGHRGQILCIESNEGIIYTGSADQTCRVWEMDTGKCLATLGDNDKVIFLKLLKDRLITSTLFRTIVRNLKSHDVEAIFDQFLDPLQTLDSNETILVTLSFDHFFRSQLGQDTVKHLLSSLSKGEFPKQIPELKEYSSKTPCLRAWDLNSQEKLWEIEAGVIQHIKVLQSELFIVENTDPQSYQVLDLKSSTCLSKMTSELRRTTCCQLKAVDSLMVITGNGQWMSWDLKTGITLYSEKLEQLHDIGKLEIKHGKVFTSAKGNNETCIWDLATGKLLRILSLENCISNEIVFENALTNLLFENPLYLGYHDEKIVTKSTSSPAHIWDFNPQYDEFLKEMSATLNQDVILPLTDLNAMLANYKSIPEKTKNLIAAHFYRIIMKKDQLPTDPQHIRLGATWFCLNNSPVTTNQKKAQAIEAYLKH